MTEQRPSEIVYDAGALAPDVRAVEALARLQLDARRRGRTASVRGASSELQDLLAFCGLSFVLGAGASAAEAGASGQEPDGPPGGPRV